MSEPEEPQVSWKAIEAEARVVGSDGEIGTIDEVVGDPEDDIFSGLAIRIGDGPRRFIDATAVVGIWPNRVVVDLPASAASTLPEFEEPPVVEWHAGDEEHGLVDRLDISKPGDDLEIGGSPQRAVMWAVGWGAVIAVVLSLVPGFGTGAGVYFGLLAFALVLVSAQLWPPMGDALCGLVVGAAAAAWLLVDDFDTQVVLGGAAIVLVSAVAVGALIRLGAARRLRR